jgi:ribosome-binding factor A
MSSEIRQQRVKSLLIEELNIMLGSELDDPRLSLISVTDVVVSKDLKNVTVYVSHQDESVPRETVISRLNKAAPYLRSQIGSRLSLRVVPELAFRYDHSPERVDRLASIFTQIASERDVQQAPPSQSGADS